ncbi:MAG: MFS transporter [Bacteroidales bacterium]|nr:MFS transporter [Bacteroidales bacterium]
MKNNSKPWAWIPTLYFAEGLPYVAVMAIAVTLYTDLKISNTEIAFYTSWLYLPWVIKPLWSPFVDIFRTKRWWVVTMQSFIGIAFACVAFALPQPFFFQTTLAFFWLLAFSSATHDIAADGFYMLGLNAYQQSFFVGIRSTFYRIAMISGQGLFVVLAGALEKGYLVSDVRGNVPLAWSITFYVLAGLFLLFVLYHKVVLPHPIEDVQIEKKYFKNILHEFGLTFISFFQKKEIGIALFYFLTYRLCESQLVKMTTPFLMDVREKGGLGLSTYDIGVAYGTFGVIGLVIGGILGGIVASNKGLKFWNIPMAVIINLPVLVFVILSYTQPTQLWLITLYMIVEQFGYGFGFTAFLLYMIYFSDGEHKTAHYAICTGFMALGMMLPGMISGWIQEQIGYQYFFLWVAICAIPGIAAAYLIKVDANFGKKNRVNK